MARKIFPNGFASWQETHFEVVSAIAIELFKDNTPSKLMAERYEAHGIGGMYELAKELTDKFEKKFKGKVWDGEWIDVLDDFIKEELFN